MQASWTLVKLGDVAIVKSGFAFKSGDMGEIGAPIIKIKNIAPPNVDIEDVQRVPFELISNNPRVEKFALQVGDILIAMTGATVGKVGRMPSSKETFYLNQRVGKVFIKGKKANYDYLYYVLSQESCASQIFSLADGSAQANISGSQIENINFLLPPVNEQTAIARFLVSLDKKIELNTKLNQTLESMAQALFKSWFVDFDPVIDNALAAGNPIPEPFQARAERRRLRLHEPVPEGKSPLQPLPAELRQLFPNSFQETDELGWVPEGWLALPLDRIANYKNGLALQKFPPENQSDSLPVVKIADLRQGYAIGIERASLHIDKGCIIDDGDVVFSWSGSLMIDIWCGGRAALNQHLFKVTSDKYPKWFYFSNTSSHLAIFQRIAADKAVTMGHIKREHLSQAYCAVPGKSLFDAVSPIFEKLLSRSVSARLESKRLATIRDMLLPRLLSGQLRIPDAEAQLAEAGL